MSDRVDSDTRSSLAGRELEEAVDRLAELMRGRCGIVLSGAGISTESGIPDYRGPSSRKRRGRPILYREFMGDPTARTRYWARSMVGWPQMTAVEPNEGHRAVAALEEADVISGVITQNVDGLHQAAGSREVVELHGSLAEVQCTECGAAESRHSLQARLVHLNPGFADRAATMAPDGDAELPAEATRTFRVPSCSKCSGVLKPNIVFFGENVPPKRVEEAFARLERAEFLLVAGSSLTVYSGFRFVRSASKRGAPVAIVNLGETRGDSLAAVRIEAATGRVLPRLARLLVG